MLSLTTYNFHLQLEQKLHPMPGLKCPMRDPVKDIAAEVSSKGNRNMHCAEVFALYVISFKKQNKRKNVFAERQGVAGTGGR